MSLLNQEENYKLLVSWFMRIGQIDKICNNSEKIGNTHPTSYLNPIHPIQYKWYKIMDRVTPDIAGEI